jgi:DNA polymerase
MTKDITPPLDENTRRYYLDVMGIQCWESLESQQANDDYRIDPTVDSDQGEGDRDVAAISWPQLQESIQQCSRCQLHGSRKQALIGRGNRSAELMFVLLSPDSRDDAEAVICSGAADDLFTKMLAAININIDDVYISSLLKCAVPENHTVSPKEISSCNTFLKQQIQRIRPKLLVVLGETAVRCLLQKDLSIDDFRAMNPGVSDGKSDLIQQHAIESVPLFVSYSPQELLQQAENKRKAWADLQQLQTMVNDQAK